jgi:hypothetical protein
MNEYMKKRQEQILAGRPLPEKKYSTLNKVSPKRQAKLDEQKKSGVKEAGKLELDSWFHNIEEKHFKNGWGVCMETGDKIPIMYARHATAHLLPKKIFKSVATHELNYLILSAQNGSHDRTHRVDKFIQMKIWPEAARRIKIMIPLLPMDELRHISNQLLEALDNTETK